jgi:hypothetical protein
MWVKLLTSDNNLNNIANFLLLLIVHNYIEEGQTYNYSKIEQIFYITKASLFKI